MSSLYTLRDASLDDIPDMLSVLHSAFGGSPLDSRVFPSNDPETNTRYVNTIQRGLDDPRSYVVVVVLGPRSSNQDSNPAVEVVGWARWVRRPGLDQLPDRHIVAPEDFPPSADRDLGVRFFQANVDVARSVMGHSPHWFLSMMVVRADCQRKGIGGLLMKYGVERADMEEGEQEQDDHVTKKGWMCYVNGSKGGAELYQKFGFETFEVSDFGGGVATWHMKREARERATVSSA